MNFKQYLENFDTTFNFLLNKDYKFKEFSDLLNQFKLSGGKILGNGKYGDVYSHPKWPFVLKTFLDDCYLRYCRFVYKNPHNSFPKLYGLPKKIIPMYKRSIKVPVIYYVRIEPLHAINIKKEDINYFFDNYNYYEKNNLEKYNYYKNLAIEYEKQLSLKHYERTIKNYEINWNFLNLMKILDKYPKLIKVIEGINILNKHNFQCALDLHSNNIMQRSNDEFVLTDPLWYGNSPYLDALTAQKMEYDNLDDYYEPELLNGGELLKRKIKKKKHIKNNIYNDVPF